MGFVLTTYVPFTKEEVPVIPATTKLLTGACAIKFDENTDMTNSNRFLIRAHDLE